MKWTPDLIQEEALKYTDKRGFKEGSRGAYEAAVRKKLIPNVCSHMKDLRPAKHTKDSVIAIAKDYTKRTDFTSQDSGAYHFALKTGILEEVCSHMKQGTSIKWNEEAITLEASKYSTRNQFKRGNSNAYNAARKLAILDSVCSHMQKPQRKWTREEVQEKALKYKTRTEFKRGDYGAYQSACREGIIDEVGSHMVLSNNSFQPMKPALLYYFSIETNDTKVWKVGVTNYTLEDRYYKRDRDLMDNIQTWEYPLGLDALNREKEIIEMFKEFKYEGSTPFTDGTSITECFSKNILDLRIEKD